MTQRSKDRRSNIADESYQLDAVVSLFAMILVILVTTAAASALGPTLFDYRSRDPEQAPIALRSLAVPYPRLETWVLRAGELLRIDYDALARHLAEDRSSQLSAIDSASGSEFQLSLYEEAGTFSLTLILPEASVPTAGGIFAERLDPTGDLTAWAAAPRPVRVIALQSGLPHLPALIRAAETAGRPLTASILPTENRKIQEQRFTGSFSLEGVLRAY